jgi:hypothetical protein
MKIIKGTIKEDFNRDLYWTRVVFLSDDEKKRTQVLVCASEEYFRDLYRLSGNQKLDQAHFDSWLDSVITKWSKFGERLLERDIHYDVYATTQDGEANGIDYLLEKQKHN